MVGLPSAKVTHLPKEAPPTYQTKLNRDGSCGLRRWASTHRHPPPRRRFGRAASPAKDGGRQLILYLKVAICRASWGLVDGQGRLGLVRAWSPRSCPGSVRPVESAAKRTGKTPPLRRGFPPVFFVSGRSAGGCRQPDRAKSCPPIKPSLTGRAACCIAKRAPSAVWESSHRAETPRPADPRKRALALLPLKSHPPRQ